MFRLKPCHSNQIAPLIVAVMHLVAVSCQVVVPDFHKLMALASLAFSRQVGCLTSRWAPSSTLTPDSMG